MAVKVSELVHNVVSLWGRTYIPHYMIIFPCRTFMTMVNYGQIVIKASKWPLFMYDEDKYDENQAEKACAKVIFSFT